MNQFLCVHKSGAPCKYVSEQNTPEEVKFKIGLHFQSGLQKTQGTTSHENMTHA